MWDMWLVKTRYIAKNKNYFKTFSSFSYQTQLDCEGKANLLKNEVVKSFGIW